MSRRARGLSGALGAVVLVLVGAAGVAGQEDFRSLDADRPTRVQDAYPLKWGEWEWEAGLRAALAEGGSGATVQLELASGAFLNAELGGELELALEDGGDGAASGLESASFHALYSFNRETWTVPGLALRADLRTPGTGDVGHEDWGGRVLGIATRSFDRLRLHANGGYAVASDADGGDAWVAGLGFDFPVGLFSRALVGDLYAELPADAGRARLWAELGTRWQVSNRDVVDLGIGTRLDRWEAGEANVELVIGFSRMFGIPPLVRVPPYPDPSIR